MRGQKFKFKRRTAWVLTLPQQSYIPIPYFLWIKNTFIPFTDLPSLSVWADMFEEVSGQRSAYRSLLSCQPCGHQGSNTSGTGASFFTCSVFKILVLCTEPRASCTLGKYAASELQPSPCFVDFYFYLRQDLSLACANEWPLRICLSPSSQHSDYKCTTNGPHHNQLFTWVLGIKLGPLPLPSS